MILLLILLIISFVIILLRNNLTPEETVSRFMYLIENKEYEKAKKYSNRKLENLDLISNIDLSKLTFTFSDDKKNANATISEEEIQENLGLCYAVPFLDDSVKMEGIPSYDEEFGPTDSKWDEYIKANREVVVPKIHERMEAENSNKKSL